MIARIFLLFLLCGLCLTSCPYDFYDSLILRGQKTRAEAFQQQEGAGSDTEARRGSGGPAFCGTMVGRFPPIPSVLGPRPHFFGLGALTIWSFSIGFITTAAPGKLTERFPRPFPPCCSSLSPAVLGRWFPALGSALQIKAICPHPPGFAFSKIPLLRWVVPDLEFSEADVVVPIRCPSRPPWIESLARSVMPPFSPPPIVSAAHATARWQETRAL